jgi:flagellar motor switch protein FliN/FliY
VSGQIVPGATGGAGGVFSRWVESLAHVLESMADRRPGTSWQALDGGPSSSAESPFLWWEQPFQPLREAVIWVGAPRAAWKHIGTRTLRAAGIDAVEEAEARNTWLEILNQWLATMARALGAAEAGEVTCGPGIERSPESAAAWLAVTLEFPDAALDPLAVGLSPGLVAALSARPAAERDNAATRSGRAEASDSGRAPAERSPGQAPGDAELAEARSRTMDLLLDVDLPVSISFGKARLPIKDVLKLTTGSIVELNRGVDEPVEVLVNQTLVARGEVVVLEGNYAVRIREIASRRERLRSLR